MIKTLYNLAKAILKLPKVRPKAYTTDNLFGYLLKLLIC